MGGKRLFQRTFVLMLAVFLLAGCSGVPIGPTATPTPIPTSTPPPTPTPIPPTPTPSLPGAKGTPVVIGESPPGVKILAMFVTDEPSFFGGKKKDPPVFPSGTEELELVIGFAPPLPDNTTIEVSVTGINGTIEMEKPVFSTMRMEDQIIVNCPLQPLSGKYNDGPYQANLIISGKQAAVFNWTVGTLP